MMAPAVFSVSDLKDLRKILTDAIASEALAPGWCDVARAMIKKCEFGIPAIGACPDSVIAASETAAKSAVADALRSVTAKCQNAYADGHRSAQVDLDDVVEILLSVADEISPE